MIEAPVGNWWIDCGEDSGVWPCEVLGPSVWPGYFRVRPTHDAAPNAWQIVSVPHRRVYDAAFNHPS